MAHTATTAYREYGDVIIGRYIGRLGGVVAAGPVRVVEDSPRRMIVHTAAGTKYRRHKNLDLAERWVDQVTPEYEDAVWTQHDVLRIMYPGDPYSIWVMWDSESGQHRCWYVNIEAPFRRIKIGFETTDYELDGVISPGFEWRWKDQDKLAEIVQLGVFTPEFAAQVREMGLDAKRRLEERREPFNEPWPEWKPDPDWGPLEMPVDNDDWLK